MVASTGGERTTAERLFSARLGASPLVVWPLVIRRVTAAPKTQSLPLPAALRSPHRPDPALATAVSWYAYIAYEMKTLPSWLMPNCTDEYFEPPDVTTIHRSRSNIVPATGERCLLLQSKAKRRHPGRSSECSLFLRPPEKDFPPGCFFGKAAWERVGNSVQRDADKRSTIEDRCAKPERKGSRGRNGSRSPERRRRSRLT